MYILANSSQMPCSLGEKLTWWQGSCADRGLCLVRQDFGGSWECFSRVRG